MGVIYALCDPRTDRIRYAGAAIDSQAKNRPRSHKQDLLRTEEKIANGQRINMHKVNWMRLLKKEGLEQQIVYLQNNIDDKIVFEQEKIWIWCLAFMGIDLLNGTWGGEGVVGKKQTEKAKKLIKDYQNRPEVKEAHRQRNLKRLEEPGAREKLIAQFKGIVRTPESEAKRIASLRRTNEEKRKNGTAGRPPQSPESHKKRSESLKKFNEKMKPEREAAKAERKRLKEIEKAEKKVNRPPQVRTPEQRAKISASLTGVKFSDERKASLSEARKKYYSIPENLEKITEINRNNRGWEHPNFIAARTAGPNKGKKMKEEQKKKISNTKRSKSPEEKAIESRNMSAGQKRRSERERLEKEVKKNSSP